MATFSSTDFDRIRDAIGEAMDEHHLPGIAVGVVAGDELVYAGAFGYADIESKRRQDPALRQRIGSVTKTMVGLCTMALVEEGRLSLDDLLVEQLPDLTFHGPASDITLRHLLTHTSGIGEVPNPEDVRRMEETLWSDDPDYPGVAEAYPDGITIDVPPGTKWAYANHGFMLLGEIVACVEGAPVQEVLRRRVFEPLGMENTDCLDEPHADLTTGYHRAPSDEARELLARIGREPPDEATVDGHNIRGRHQYVRGRAAGAVQSNIPDMARYASALLRRGGGIVQPGTFDAMAAPQWCPDERLASIGLTFFRERRFGRTSFGHGGGVVGGWNTHISVLPDEGIALLTHMNVSFEQSPEVDARILRAVLDAPEEALPDLAVDRGVLAAAPGVYEAAPGALTNFRIVLSTGRVQVSADGSGLMLYARRGPWKAGVRMRPLDANDPSLFALETDNVERPRVVLVRDADGTVTGLRFDRLVEMVRTNQVAPWA